MISAISFRARMRRLLHGDRDKKPSNECADLNSGTILVEVNPLEDEYWRVLGRLQREMPDARISRLWRIRNEPLSLYYQFHKDRLTMNGVANHNEVEVWHGTRTVDPGVVYRDRQDGFMVQFAGVGTWGRGIYFAEHSNFSDAYAHNPNANPATLEDRPAAAPDEREMFLAKLLVGNPVELVETDKTLVAPPHDPSSKPGQRYHTAKSTCTVLDTSLVSPAYVVYENGRAYPQYLVRYYKGALDRTRTPYETLAEAKEAGALWQFLDNNGWADYRQAHQAALEAARRNGNRTLQVRTEQWNYEVDLQSMVQTNLDHANHKRRQVRRLSIP
jgi:Poly(ADP-ribose) polymerase catalytic domain/WWE domain